MDQETRAQNVASAEEALDMAGGDARAASPDRSVSEAAASELDRRTDTIVRSVPRGGVRTSRIAGMAAATVLSVVSAGVVISKMVAARRARDRKGSRMLDRVRGGLERVRAALRL